MKVSPINRLKYLSMFYIYLMNYGKGYSDSTRKYIKSEFLKRTQPGDIPLVLLELYAKFGMLPDEENIYLNFAKMIGEIYGWDTKILEVGGGKWPIFSQYIDKFQTDSLSGTITVMDPALVVDKLGKVKLNKENFTRRTDVSDFDLLVGIAPCEATHDIIKSAIVNKKEFFIAMCSCIHSDIPYPWFMDYNLRYNMWKEETLGLAKTQENDGFEVNMYYVNNFLYPIIYSKKKK